MRMLDYIGLEVSLIIRLPALVEDLHNPLFLPDLASWCAGESQRDLPWVLARAHPLSHLEV
jgi:hypothetical protein